MKAKFELIRSYFTCTHKNYDQGHIEETVVAKFTTREKAEAYLKKNELKLRGGYGRNDCFTIRSIEKVPKVPVDPE